jgi:hypothetical protein
LKSAETCDATTNAIPKLKSVEIHQFATSSKIGVLPCIDATATIYCSLVSGKLQKLQN